MSVKYLVRHYGVRIAVLLVLAIILSNVVRSMPTTSISLFLNWLVNAVMIPLIILLAIRFIGNAIIEVPNLTKHSSLYMVIYIARAVIVSLLGPALFIYLFLSATVEALPHTVYTKADLVANILFVIIIGILISRLGNKFGVFVGSSLTYLGAAVALLGLSNVLAQVYPPITPLFEYPGIAALALSLVPLMGLSKSLGPVHDEILRVSRYAMAIFTVLGIMAFLIGIPQLAPYSNYISTASLLLMAMIMAFIGYRVYRDYSQWSERVPERIYQQHMLEMELMMTTDDTEFINAVKNFLINGRKEELIAYTSYALSQCMEEFAKVRESITDLLNYEPARRGWTWEGNVEVINKEIERRKEIINKVIDTLRNCQTRAELNPH